jgi:hypothetical protein
MNPQIEKLKSRVALLGNINSDEKGRWGVMTAQNMIEHLGGVFYSTSLGKTGKLMLAPEQASKLKNRFFSAYYPFPQNVKMPGTQDKPTVAPPHRYASFEEALEKLNSALDKFLEALATTPQKPSIHGYFGYLTMEEWLNFHVKHVEHHLIQFRQLPEMDEKIPKIEKSLYKLRTNITADTPAKWGKMNAQQMVEHLGIVFLLSTGKFNIEYKGTQEDAQKYWEDFVKSPQPWKTVFPTVNFTEPRPTRHETIEASLAELWSTWQKYLTYCEENPEAVNAHFFLGNLPVDQWRQVHVKHFEHHLRQFGIIED